jgi:hypothetical protein
MIKSRLLFDAFIGAPYPYVALAEVAKPSLTANLLCAGDPLCIDINPRIFKLWLNGHDGSAHVSISSASPARTHSHLAIVDVAVERTQKEVLMQFDTDSKDKETSEELRTQLQRLDRIHHEDVEVHFDDPYRPDSAHPDSGLLLKEHPHLSLFLTGSVPRAGHA